MERINGKTIMASFGFGCFLALNALTLWSPLAFLPSTLSEANPDFYFVVNFGFAISFAIVAFGHFGNPSRLPRMLFGSTVALLVIGFLLSGYSLGGALALPGAVLSMGALCIGLGSGFGLVCWMMVFSSFEFRIVWLIIVVGSVFAALPTLAIYFVSSDNPAPFSSLVLVVLLLSIVFLVLNMRDELLVQESGNVSIAASGMYKTIVRRFGIVLPYIAALALFQPVLDATGLVDQLSVFSKTMSSQLGNIAGALSMLFIGRITEWRMDVSKVFVWITPVFATVCLFFPFVAEQYWFIFSFLGMLFFAMLSIAVMLACLQFSQAGRTPIAAVYSLLACCLYAPSLVGSVVGSMARNAGVSSRYALYASLLLIVMLCIALAVRVWKNWKNNRTSESDSRAYGVACGVDASDSMQAACGSISKSLGLTHRETEILRLLAHGRDVPFVSESLHLSPHTVRGYVKTLYQRIGVHSRQELIDFVETWMLCSEE